MFGVDGSELLIVAALALIFIGPKELPTVMMRVGRVIGKVRGYARHFTSGVEQVIREAELEEMEKKWREENARIMAQHPPEDYYPDPEPRQTSGHGLEAGEEQVMLPLEARAAPDDDPRPPSERELP